MDIERFVLLISPPSSPAAHSARVTELTPVRRKNHRRARVRHASGADTLSASWWSSVVTGWLSNSVPPTLQVGRPSPATSILDAARAVLDDGATFSLGSAWPTDFSITATPADHERPHMLALAFDLLGEESR
jgi:hypothetical protein